jgi:hypothetical protein
VVFAYAVSLLAVVYKSWVSFYRTWMIGGNHTIGKPNPQFWLCSDRN